MAKDLVETLKSFVPALLVKRLAVDPSEISEPTAERFAAAVLFVDITDFTAMADQLAQQGLRGSEDLAHLLNEYFGQLINLIHSHGGEVTKFAGDALLALWPVSGELVRQGPAAQNALQEQAHLAAQCGLAIQSSYQDYRLGRGKRLRLQVGLGAGDVYSVHLGGVFNRWEFLLSGSPLVQMSVAKELARSGQVVLSPEMWVLVKDRCVGRPIGDGFTELLSISRKVEPTPLTLPTLKLNAKACIQSYIPAAVISRLEAGHEEWLSELRYVTVLFIKLPRYGTSIKHPYSRTLPQAQAVMRALQTALYHYAGSINKLNVDDKGITLVAALGLPPLSHGDDAARAVHAALEMQGALEALGRQSAIGITTGWAFCGPIGTPERREYTMVGNTVNMAARLMQAAEVNMEAEGSNSYTLCDETTFAVVQEQFEDGRELASKLAFRRLPLMGVKGIDEPVAAYRPRRKRRSIAQTRQTREMSQIIGRRAELARFEKLLLDLKRGIDEPPGKLLIIEAEAGGGKSLLLRYMKDRAEALQVRTLFGEGRALDQSSPYVPWRPIFRSIFGLESMVEDSHLMRSRILSQLPPIQGERGYPALAVRLSPLLNDVLPFGFPENATTRKMEGARRRNLTEMFLLRLLQRTVTGPGQKIRPTLLIFENGQWLDHQSWDLLISASYHIGPLLVVVASRPLRERALGTNLAQISRRLWEANHVEWMRLTRLDAEKAVELICQSLGVSSVPEEVIQTLVDKTDGHPLFSQELARHWFKKGLLEVNGDVCQLVGQSHVLQSGGIPDNVYSTIIGRFERLTPRFQLVLKIASVIGRCFDTTTLSKIYPIPAEVDQLPTSLETLSDWDFIDRVGEGTYCFSYGLLHEAAYNLLLFSQRQALQDTVRRTSQR